MARTGRSFPARVLQNGRQMLAVPQAPATPPLPRQIIVNQAGATAAAQQDRERRPHIIQTRWPGYEWVGLPPINPTPKQFVMSAAVVTATRRERHGFVSMSRWPGYEWVGLPPVTPMPRQVIVSPSDDAVAAMRLPRRVHTTTPRPEALDVPVSPPPPLLRRIPPPRQGRAQRTIWARWPGYQWVALPPITPLVMPMIRLASSPRRRLGKITLPWPLALAVQQAQATVTPLPALVVRAVMIRRRPGRVTMPSVDLAAAQPAPPVTTPLPRALMVAPGVQARRAGRLMRRFVTAPIEPQAPTTPPRALMVNTAQLRRVPRVLHRFLAAPAEPQAPITPPRPLQVEPPQRRARPGRVTSTTRAQLIIQPQAPATPPQRAMIVTPRRRRDIPGRVLWSARQALAATAPIVYAIVTGRFQSSPTPGVSDAPVDGEYQDGPSGGASSNPTSGKFD